MATTCTGAGRGGRPCRMTLGLRELPGGGAVCAWHDPGRKALAVSRRGANARRRAEAALLARRGALRSGAAPGGDPPPCPPMPCPGGIATAADALALARWVPVAAAVGAIGAREAAAVVGALREWRMANADAELEGRLAALEARVRAARARGADV